jgi:tRNA G46 methylase TrmB
VLDLGTGDGAAVLRAARLEPACLAIGVDAEVSRLQDASRRGRRAGLSNTLFLAGDAADALRLVSGRVDELRITLPWGSLLRLVLEGEQAFAQAVAGSL